MLFYYRRTCLPASKPLLATAAAGDSMLNNHIGLSIEAQVCRRKMPTSKMNESRTDESEE